MKKSTQLALLLLLLGFALFITGFQGSDRDISKINGSFGAFTIQTGHRNSELVDSRQYECAAKDVKRIIVDEGNASIRLLPSPDNRLHILYQETDGEAMDIRLDNGILRVRRQGESFGIYLAPFDSDRFLTEIQIPSDHSLALEVGSDNGTVSANDLRLSGDAVFTTNNGKILLNGIPVNDLIAESNNGDIRLSGTCAGVELRNSNGSITAEALDCRSLRAQLSNGAIRLSNVSSASTINAETSNGSIQVMDVSASSSLSLETSNGAIRGELAGKMADYHIQTETDLGKCNLPDNWGDGDIQLHVSTNLGVIDLHFAED